MFEDYFLEHFPQVRALVPGGITGLNFQLDRRAGTATDRAYRTGLKWPTFGPHFNHARQAYRGWKMTPITSTTASAWAA